MVCLGQESELNVTPAALATHWDKKAKRETIDRYMVHIAKRHLLRIECQAVGRCSSKFEWRGRAEIV